MQNIHKISQTFLDSVSQDATEYMYLKDKKLVEWISNWKRYSPNT